MTYNWHFLWARLWKDVSPGQYCGSRSTWDIVTYSNPLTNVNYFCFERRVFYTNLQYSFATESELGALQLQYINILTLAYAWQIMLETLITSKQSARNLASSAHQQTSNDRTVQPAYLRKDYFLPEDVKCGFDQTKVWLFCNMHRILLTCVER